MISRNFYYHAVLFVHTALLLVVAVLVWYGNRRSTLATRRQLDDLRGQFELFSSLAGSSSPAPSRVLSSESSSLVKPSAASDWVRVPPRILGSGRSRNWSYVDVVYGDGATRRHFVRTNSTPREVHAFVRGLSDESRVHSWVCVAGDE